MAHLRNFMTGTMFGAALPKPNELEELPINIWIEGSPSFYFSRHISKHEGYPILDWSALKAWINSIECIELQRKARIEAERAWLLHMREALGRGFQLIESKDALVLSSLDANVARATVEYIDRTRGRVIQLLEGIAQIPPLGKDLLLVFDDEESYYRYVSRCYPDDGEFAFSGGMYVNAGCGHYVTMKNGLHEIEPVIAHEMTHGCLSHLSLPVWLDEGLAVNIEHRLAGARPAHTPQQLRNMHLAFWNAQEIQVFWSGASFLRADNASLLSYDLARIIVEQLGKNWELLTRFVLTANEVDAGAISARQHLGVDLGEFVCALLDQEPSRAWSPDSDMWITA